MYEVHFSLLSFLTSPLPNFRHLYPHKHRHRCPRIHLHIYPRIYPRIHLHLYPRLRRPPYPRINLHLYPRINIHLYPRIHLHLYPRLRRPLSASPSPLSPSPELLINIHNTGKINRFGGRMSGTGQGYGLLRSLTSSPVAPRGTIAMIAQASETRPVVIYTQTYGHLEPDSNRIPISYR